MKGKDISFLCGDSGPLAIGAVLFHKVGKPERMKECISHLLSLLPSVVSQESRVPDELLYGRVGYLYSLLFVNKYIPGAIPNDNFKQVMIIKIQTFNMNCHPLASNLL